MRRALIITAFCLLQAGCSVPKMTLQAEATFSQQAVKQSGERVNDYGTFEDLVDFYLTLPPPPPTQIDVPPIITPAPGAPDPYAPLLAFIQAGPGGSNITKAHLVHLTPATLSLAQLWLSQTVTQAQLFNSAPAWQLMFAAQPILQTLGMWNQQMLQQWLAYTRPQFPRLLTIATNFYNNIVAPPPPGQPTITPQPPIIHAINPIEVMQTFSKLWKTKDWLKIGERFSGLLYPLISPSGFSEPMLVLYGSRRRYFEPTAQTMRNNKGELEVHNINREGYYKNEAASGAGRFFQGEDDISLNYYPVEIENRRVETLDVVASDRFALLKRMAGGDVNLLSRSYTHNTSLLSANAAFGKKHLRVVGGVTPYSSMGGLMGEITYSYEYLSGRIGGGGLVETALHGNTDTLIGFLDTEHKLSSPMAMIESKDEKRAAFAWASLTVSASVMGDRSLTEQPDKRTFTNKLGIQGDVRLIPELHSQLDAEYVSFYIYGGITSAVVPIGRVNLDNPERSVSLDYVRTHLGSKMRVLVSKIVKNCHDDEFDHTMYADFAVVGEFSALVRRWRVTTDFTLDQFKVGLIGEAEQYQYGGLDDLRLGGRASFMGAYVSGLKSLEFDDFQLQAGFEIEL
jgi:hypothetical protein